MSVYRHVVQLVKLGLDLETELAIGAQEYMDRVRTVTLN